MKRSLLVVRSSLLLSLLVVASCTAPSQKADGTAVGATLAAGQTAFTEAPLAQHRIGVRSLDGVGEFYDKQTGEKFVPRGANYVFVPLGNAHTIMLLQVGTYDPQRTRADFAKLAALGYNTVRVFLDHCNQGNGCIVDSDHAGLNPLYLDNIADMMAAAHETGVFILFTSNDLPDGGGYSEEANIDSGSTFAGYRNSYYLRPQAITATRRYWGDLLSALVQRHAAFDGVLGWELVNEEWMFKDQPPLSLTSGNVETTTGTYDMSSSEQKAQMVSDGLIYYVAQVKQEILAYDPTALVTMGFFVPEIAAPDWYDETASLLQRAQLDFFDFHAYPGGASLKQHAEHFGMIDYAAKPILMGEYGAFHHIYPDADSAGRALTEWTAQSCQFGFDGWLYWAYYPADATAGDATWGLVDEGDSLLKLLAPADHPDPCVRSNQSNDNLAYNKPVTASRSLPQQPAGLAVDDDAATLWNAGGDPVQWIAVDLLGQFRVSEIRLLVAQYPTGDTTHRLQVRSSSAEAFQTVHEFAASTGDGDWLVFKPDVPLESVSEVRILTVRDPSWVAWKEIQVYGEAVSP